MLDSVQNIRKNDTRDRKYQHTNKYLIGLERRSRNRDHECHTPRDENGNLIRDEYLNGAPVPVKAPPYPQINWAVKAPAIVGLIGYTDEQGVRLLTSGVTRDGRVPNPPMPPFRMSVRDAEAVVAYLKSLQ